MSSSPTSRSSLATTVEVTMPQMGVSVAEGTVAEWRKRAGDWVEADETIVEISTDKVETEVPSPASGRVSAILVEVGVTVDIGTPLAKIDTAARPGEAHADEGQPEEAPASTRAEEPQPDRAAENGGRDALAPPVSPVVRRMAAEHGVDLSVLTGTGRRGRVTKKDLLAFLEQRARAERSRHAAREAEPALHTESPYSEKSAGRGSAPAPAAPEPAGTGPSAGAELSVMRKRIGENMVHSLRTAAHCTTVVEVDMSRVESARGRLSYLPFVARAAIAALREHPGLNATLEGNRLTVHEEVHLGVAVALGGDGGGEPGLIVPVVRNAHELSHEGLATRIADLAARARRKRLEPGEVRGGTFTITNPGRYGALLATPIINQPQVAILDLEAVVRRPVAITGPAGDSIAVRPMTYLCMSWDHRALDGVLAARFLASVKRGLEEWSG